MTATAPHLAPGTSQRVQSSDSFCLVETGDTKRARAHAWIDALDPAQTWTLSAVSLSNPRTVTQNATAWRLYGLAAAASGDRPVPEIARECKLCYGVPILCATDPEYVRLFDASMAALTYEQRLSAMDVWPVTRLMNVRQMSRYIDAIQLAYGVCALGDDPGTTPLHVTPMHIVPVEGAA
ncbi:MAG TPA: hypothetical protein VFQ88_07255 [Nevskiaceae bacterium]|nr:hypothetical protein [Nevskiaceae bacterium]